VAVETTELVLKSNVSVVIARDKTSIAATEAASVKLKAALEALANTKPPAAKPLTDAQHYRALERSVKEAEKAVRDLDKAQEKSAEQFAKRRAKANSEADKRAVKAAVKAADNLPASLRKQGGAPDLSGFQKVLAMTRSIFGDKAAGGLAAGAQKLVQAGESLGPAGPMLLKAGGVLGGAAAGIAVAGAALVAAAAVVAYKLGAAFASQAIESVSFKKNTLAGLEAMLKSKAAAKATYADLKKFADLEAPFETADVASNFKKLLGAGFSQSETKDVLRGSFDLAALNDGNKEVADQVVNALAKIQGQGKITSDTMEQIITASGGAVSRKGLLDQLAKSTGKSVEALEKELSSGKIKADAGIKAILETIRLGVSGGKLGALSKSLTGESVGGLTSTIKSQLTGLFEDIDISPLTDTLKNASGVLAGPAGAKLKTSFTGLGTQLFKTLFGPFQGPDGAAKMERFVGTITRAADAATKALAAAAPYVKAFVDEADALINGNDSGTSPILTVLKGVHDFAYLALVPLKLMGTAIDALLYPFKMIGANIDQVKKTLAGGQPAELEKPKFSSLGFDVDSMLPPSITSNDTGAPNVGANMAKGVAQGVADNGSAIADSMVNAVNAAVKAAEAALGIASPAKRLITTGKWSALGMAKGWEDNAGAVADAATGTANAAANAAAGGTSGAQGRGAGGAMPSIQISIAIDGGKGDKGQIAQAAGEAAEAGVRRALRGIQRDAAESGATVATRAA